MLGLDSGIAGSEMRLWIAAGAAALLVLLWAMVFGRRPGSLGALLAPGAILGAALTCALLGGQAMTEQGAERRALEARASELTMRALTPGSPLACLDNSSGDSVEAACEKALFVNPGSVAAASSYVTAKFTLLNDMTAYVQRGGTDLAGPLAQLRRSLEADRFGMLAHVLAVSDGCSSDNCKALAILNDATRVRTNLHEDTFDRYLGRYLIVWAQADGQVADATPVTPPPQTTAAAAPAANASAHGSRKVSVNIDFPTSASIPPVSIMSPEQKGSPSAPPAAAPSLPAAAAFADPNPRAPAMVPPPKGRKPGASSAAQADATASVPQTEAVDPVWSPAPAARPPVAPATTAEAR
jgi:hypothetical protein